MFRSVGFGTVYFVQLCFGGCGTVSSVMLRSVGLSFGRSVMMRWAMFWLGGVCLVLADRVSYGTVSYG